MASDTNANPAPMQPDTPPGADEAAPGIAAPPPRGPSWQGPALIGAAMLMVAGAVVAFTRRPSLDIGSALSRAERALSDERAEDALVALERDVAPYLAEPAAHSEFKSKFYLLRADARAVRERDAVEPSVSAAEAIVRDYEAAVDAGATLDALRNSRLAEALMRAGRTDRAVSIARTLPDGAADARVRLQKVAIEAAVARLTDPVAPAVRAARLDEALRLLSRYQVDPSLTEADRAWAFARQAELRLNSGQPEEAVLHLLQTLPRLQDPSGPEAGEMHLLLARGLFEQGRLSESSKQATRALQILPATSPLQPAVSLLLGNLAYAAETPQDARERFIEVIETSPDTPEATLALIGLAESEAALGAFDDSIAAFGRAALLLDRGDAAARARANAEFMRSLAARTSERLDADDPERALALASLALRAAPESDVPAWVNQSLAIAHRSLGERLLEPARLRDGSIDWGAIDRVATAEVRTHFAEASARFEAHARQSIGADDAAYGASLWDAADAADSAGDQSRSIALFSEFAAGRPGDPRRPAAAFRVAQAHQARADHQTAADTYRTLIAENPPSGERFRSIVPLAQCLIADDEPDNDAEAERLLRQAVSGEGMPPDAPEFRAALNQLGSLYHRQNRFPEAIERLTESVDRFPTDPAFSAQGAPRVEGLAPPGGVDLTRLLLADCYRRSARDIAAALQEAMPQATRTELASLRDERLRAAMNLYAQVCAAPSQRDPLRMPEGERIARRNAYFYRADCAFDLGEFDRAIEWYDDAAGRYADDPASLVAMVQIVNVYAQTGRWEEARTANERAHQRFRELPPEAFADKDLPLEREHWERWLEARSQVALQQAAAGEPPQPPPGAPH